MKLMITGGTLDKRYAPLSGELIFSQSSLENMLQQARVTLDLDLEVLMLKDSLDLDNKDRQKIVAACVHCQDPNIVITHGTDTMVKTAKALASNMHDKTIVLCGAMVPYQFKHSDALFNLGCAVAAAQSMPNGVYITMNGNIFEHHQVSKNKATGQFERLHRS